MKRFVSVLMILSLMLSGCGTAEVEVKPVTNEVAVAIENEVIEEVVSAETEEESISIEAMEALATYQPIEDTFTSLGNADLLRYVEDTVYLGIGRSFG